MVYSQVSCTMVPGDRRVTRGAPVDLHGSTGPVGHPPWMIQVGDPRGAINRNHNRDQALKASAGFHEWLSYLSGTVVQLPNG